MEDLYFRQPAVDVDFLENEPRGQRQHLAVLLQKRGSTGLDLIRQAVSVANVTIVAAKMLKMEMNYYLCFINEPNAHKKSHDLLGVA